MTGKALLAVGCLALIPLLAGERPKILREPYYKQKTRLIYSVRPVYPELAKKARIQGVVRLHALIGKDGAVEELRLLSGHPLLVKAAMDAVKQWRFEPYRVMGEPVAVATTIDISFSLSSSKRCEEPDCIQMHLDLKRAKIDS